MKLTLGFSPCPNDTFIFDALVNGKIDPGDLQFEPVLEDVETLNRWALEGRLDITKLSFPAYFRSLENYVLLHAGSALGRGVGPLLVSREAGVAAGEGIAEKTILLPGVNTTAHLLFTYAFPLAHKKSFTVFSEIEDQVLQGMADLGVIIHENRFTYRQKGLHKVMDLGEYWESRLQVPIPLGGIAIRRHLPAVVQEETDRLINASLRYAFDKYPALPEYVRQHAQSMDEPVMRQHIDLYVNDFSLGLGAAGKQAIETLEDVYRKVNGITSGPSPFPLFR